MLQNAHFLAKIGADTAENEQHFAEILPKIGNYPTSAVLNFSSASAHRARHAWTTAFAAYHAASCTGKVYQI